MRQVFILLFPFFLISCNVYSYLTKPKQEIQKELSRLMDFSKQMVEDEYYLKEFNIDKY